MKQRPNSEQAIKAFRLRNSCNSIAKHVVQTSHKLNFHNCYCNHLDSSINHLLDIHQKYEQGILYYPGSLSEQPSKIIEVFNLLSQLKTEEQQKQAKKNKGK